MATCQTAFYVDLETIMSSRCLTYIYGLALMLAALIMSSLQVYAQPQSFSYGADVSDGFDTLRLGRVDSAFQRVVDAGLLPHCVTFVAHKGRVVHNKAYGWRNIEDSVECQVNDIFRIASQTKAICAVAFMTLVEEGKVDIDQPLKRYIPEFDKPQVIATYDKNTKKFTTRKAKRDILIRDLLTHTSGLTYEGAHSEICKNKGVCQHLSLDSLTLKQNVEKMATVPLAFDPGTSFGYGPSTDVLGRLCEIVSGQDISTFLNERIFEPLGMNNTYFYVPDSLADRVVKLYKYTKTEQLTLSTVEALQAFPYSGAKMYCSTGAGLCGTIEDYAKFCQMILNKGEFNGRRIIGRKTLEWMQKNGVGEMRGEIGFGMAWDVFTPQNAHNTIITEGSMRWGGMFGTDYVIDPQEELIVLMYTNCMPNTSGVNPKTLLINTVYQALK